ncbi:MAG TPA: AIR synthase-related protein [Thermoanaerobaculia bacterium]|nr:AIR synthase-related protein [Thermoanaerobaculia bacterium]HUM30221.1 AIR synthase-related protein [Thermoanaerobaculia bacterium]HXK68483.1 AIR synthase-related protein [Thermoanaerobaculia bacterium]
MRLKTGKLPPEILAAFTKTLNFPSNLIVEPGVGEDAAVIVDGNRNLVVASDPITFVSDRAGYYAVVVNANDVAATGAEPEFFFAVVLLRAGAQCSEAEHILTDIATTCTEMNICLAGGHTEITHDLPMTVICGTCIGWTARPLPSRGVREGDLILQVRPIPLEAISILARERHDSLVKKVGSHAVEEAKAVLLNPGISVVDEARILAANEGVHALHDVTEGGIAGGLWEISRAAGVQLNIDRETILIHPLWEKTGAQFNLPVMETIGSGCLLASIDPDYLEETGKILTDRGMPWSVIGHASQGEGVRMNGKEFPCPERDAITALWESEPIE